MPWYQLVLPAALTALVIRLDAVWIGPYWTFMEVVPGMGGTDVEWWYERPTLRWAIARRYLYVVLLGVALAFVDDELTIWDAALVGAFVAGLLLWPIVFHGLPYGIAPSDWQLIPLYLGVVMSFTGAGATGWLAIEYIREQSGGDVGKWITDKAGETALFWLIGIAGYAFFRGSLSSLREKKRKREEGSYASDNL